MFAFAQGVAINTNGTRLVIPHSTSCERINKMFPDKNGPSYEIPSVD